MNFSQLNAFVALAEAGTFTAAAERVNLTQSAVSHALTALESELGVTLLERTRKGVVALSPTGEKVMPHVRALLAHAEAIEQEAKAANGLATGKVRVGNTACFCPGVLTGILGAFQRQYPEVELVLFEGTLQEITGWIASSVVDVGFMPLAMGEHGAGQEGDTALITTDELCVIVRTEHKLSTRKWVTDRELRGESFIMPKSDCTSRMMSMAGIEPNRAATALRYQASDTATILTMVREGLGITLMPRMSLPPKTPGVVVIPFEPVVPLQVGLSLRSRKMATPATKLFVDTALRWAQAQSALHAPVD